VLDMAWSKLWRRFLGRVAWPSGSCAVSSL